MTAPEKFLRLRDVLGMLGIKKTCWWKGIKEGRFPRGHLIGTRTRIWTQQEIHQLMEKIASNKFN